MTEASADDETRDAAARVIQRCCRQRGFNSFPCHAQLKRLYMNESVRTKPSQGTSNVLHTNETLVRRGAEPRPLARRRPTS